MNITDILIMFRETQDAKVFGMADEKSDLEELNVMTIEVLAWLKLEYKRLLWQKEGKKTKLKPLHLNKQFSWCKLLEDMINSKTIFSNIFEIRDNNLCFKNEVAEEYRLCARKSAFEKYNPAKII